MAPHNKVSVNGPADRKREPIPHAVDPGLVSQLGADENRPVHNVYSGRGFEGPKPHNTSHPSGSQGNHK